jgi:hypothetical protein
MLEWTEMQPGWSWRSTNGTYIILRAVLPESTPRPMETYTLRKIDPAMAAALPGSAGYFRGEHYHLAEAKDQAERDAYCDEHAAERSVPGDLPAVALARFFWPISEGTTQAALAVVRDGDRIVARVVGMARQEDPFVPVTYAEIDLTGILEPAEG